MKHNLKATTLSANQTWFGKSHPDLLWLKWSWTDSNSFLMMNNFTKLFTTEDIAAMKEVVFTNWPFSTVAYFKSPLCVRFTERVPAGAAGASVLQLFVPDAARCSRCLSPWWSRRQRQACLLHSGLSSKVKQSK